MASDPKTVRDYLLLALDPSEGSTPNFEQFRRTMSADWFNNHIPHGRKTALRFLPLRELLSEFVPEMLDLYPVETLDQIDAILAPRDMRYTFAHLWLANPSWISTAERFVKAFPLSYIEYERIVATARLYVYFFTNPVASSVFLDLSTRPKGFSDDYKVQLKYHFRTDILDQIRNLPIKVGSPLVPADWPRRVLSWVEQIMRGAGKDSEADLTASLSDILEEENLTDAKRTLRDKEFVRAFEMLRHNDFEGYNKLANAILFTCIHKKEHNHGLGNLVERLAMAEWFREDSYLESLARWQGTARSLTEALELPPLTTFLDPVL